MLWSWANKTSVCSLNVLLYISSFGLLKGFAHSHIFYLKLCLKFIITVKYVAYRFALSFSSSSINPSKMLQSSLQVKEKKPKTYSYVFILVHICCNLRPNSVCTVHNNQWRIRANERIPTYQEQVYFWVTQSKRQRDTHTHKHTYIYTHAHTYTHKECVVLAKKVISAFV